MHRIRALPHGRQHALLLAGMAGHYLSMPVAAQAEARLATRSVLAAIGGLAAPTMLVMGARRALGTRMNAPDSRCPGHRESETIKMTLYSWVADRRDGH